MKEQFSNKPEILTPADEISMFYRWNINEITIEDETSNPRTLWEADSVLLYYPITKDNILKNVIKYYWDNDTEKKLINDYLSTFVIVNMDIVLQELYINRYRDFITKRNELKNIIEADCQLLNIQ
jgi:hypothetical protein